MVTSSTRTNKVIIGYGLGGNAWLAVRMCSTISTAGLKRNAVCLVSGLLLVWVIVELKSAARSLATHQLVHFTSKWIWCIVIASASHGTSRAIESRFRRAIFRVCPGRIPDHLHGHNPSNLVGTTCASRSIPSKITRRRRRLMCYAACRVTWQTPSPSTPTLTRSHLTPKSPPYSPGNSYHFYFRIRDRLLSTAAVP